MVPSQLIGRLLTIHLYHDRLVGYVGKQQVVELPRLRGDSQGTKRRVHCINYRIIERLRRKPRAFLYCTWQQELLPTEQLLATFEDKSQTSPPLPPRSKGKRPSLHAPAFDLRGALYRMLWTSGEPYRDPGADYYEQRYQQRVLDNLKKKASALGFDLVAQSPK
jgi:hypothetical protein